MYNYESTTPDPVHQRLQYTHGKSGCDRSIHSVAATLQNLSPNFRSNPVLGRDHTLIGFDLFVSQYRSAEFH
jgi:hypothetical protein